METYQETLKSKVAKWVGILLITALLVMSVLAIVLGIALGNGSF